ncbi:NADH-quinone oxidoreductase subunit J [Peredibacter sp. HCB2-198]|uniref:NADH-quinone oxidoreductase subunit J family protein n=1 Tax=Peredibacter sp. HCB2-198 TaxID=3383025 RepID=UPI0038B4814E
MNPVILILGVVSAILAVNMLLAKNPITSAMSLLGILLMSAGIYAMIGEHFIATIQLVVYAGAIMVLFIFSIMLLNLSDSESELKRNPGVFAGAVALGLGLFGFIAYAINEHFLNHRNDVIPGKFTPEVINQLGGNSKVMAHSLFTQYYVSFEVITLALLVAVVGAVVLAKRKFD